ncbi:MAG: Glycosyl transferase family 2 [Microgenomates group bacterium GW2011_GWC1_46_15]|nr:MAG: Glycosyl transferase family 2 [Microgenomates group bacterium GW2011_GWC1_46_15]
MTRLSIIILSYNTKQYLEQVLRSLARVKKNDWEVIVVDNASQDGSAQMVKEEFPFVKCIMNKKNVGFSAGNNSGIRRAQGAYVLLLNSDTEVHDAESIPTLLSYMDKHPDVGVVTPKVVLADGTMDMASHQTWKGVEYTHEVDACTAAAMLVRAAAIDEVGLLDEQFFMYGEDLDWCYRFRKAGWKIVYNPEATIIHHKNKSGVQVETNDEIGKMTKKQATSQFFDTMELFYRKHYGKVYPRWFLGVVQFGVRCIRSMKGV